MRLETEHLRTNSDKTWMTLQDSSSSLFFLFLLISLQNLHHLTLVTRPTDCADKDPLPIVCTNCVTWDTIDQKSRVPIPRCYKFDRIASKKSTDPLGLWVGRRHVDERRASIREGGLIPSFLPAARVWGCTGRIRPHPARSPAPYAPVVRSHSCQPFYEPVPAPVPFGPTTPIAVVTVLGPSHF